MMRWLVGGLGVALVVTAVLAATARLVGRRSRKAAAALDVGTAWLGAWVVWTLVDLLATAGGWDLPHDGRLYVLLALGAGWWQYRTWLAAGRERALALFVGAQLLWGLALAVASGALG